MKYQSYLIHKQYCLPVPSFRFYLKHSDGLRSPLAPVDNMSINLNFRRDNMNFRLGSLLFNLDTLLCSNGFNPEKIALAFDRV